VFIEWCGKIAVSMALVSKIAMMELTGIGGDNGVGVKIMQSYGVA